MSRFSVSCLVAMTLVYHSAILANSAVLFCCIAEFADFSIRQNRIGAGFLFGLFWAGLNGQQIVENSLPSQLNGVDIAVIGMITDIPKRSTRKTRFYFTVDRFIDQQVAPSARLLSLAWYVTRL